MSDKLFIKLKFRMCVVIVNLNMAFLINYISYMHRSLTNNFLSNVKIWKKQFPFHQLFVINKINLSKIQ